MAESRLASPIIAVDSYNVSSVVFIYILLWLSLGSILILDLVVANLFMHSLPGIILLYLTAPFFIPKVFLHKISLLCKVHALL